MIRYEIRTQNLNIHCSNVSTAIDIMDKFRDLDYAELIMIIETKHFGNSEKTLIKIIKGDQNELQRKIHSPLHQSD